MSPFEAEWVRCQSWIAQALQAGPELYTLNEVRSAVERGEAHFWPGQRSAAVTEFVHYPRRKALNFWLLGGDGRELVNGLRPDIEAWARTQDCTLFFGLGARPSWGRALKRHGYAPVWQCFMKDVADGR